MDEIDISKVKTYPISERENKMRVEDFASLPPSHSIGDLVKSMPNVLRATDFRALVDAVCRARKGGRQIIWMMGAHVIKCGLTPVLVDLAERGFLTHIATNGAGAIHDFEIAYQGATSEDVETTIKDGSFGMAEETGRLMNDVIRAAVEMSLGYGYALGIRIGDLDLPHKESSLLWNMRRMDIPATIHCAIGTDTINQHPSFSGSALGAASFTDFKIFSASVAELEGGVILNIGSAVILPEVFLKALSIARNIGNTVESFTAANFDMVSQYRPKENVLSRPTGGGGYDFRGHHEIMIPLFAAVLRES